MLGEKNRGFKGEVGPRERKIEMGELNIGPIGALGTVLGNRKGLKCFFGTLLT